MFCRECLLYAPAFYAIDFRLRCRHADYYFDITPATFFRAIFTIYAATLRVTRAALRRYSLQCRRALLLPCQRYDMLLKILFHQSHLLIIVTRDVTSRYVLITLLLPR